MKANLKRIIATTGLAGSLGLAGAVAPAAPASAITARCYNIMAAMEDSLEQFELAESFAEKRHWYGSYLIARRAFNATC